MQVNQYPSEQMIDKPQKGKRNSQAQIQNRQLQQIVIYLINFFSEEIKRLTAITNRNNH